MHALPRPARCRALAWLTAALAWPISLMLASTAAAAPPTDAPQTLIVAVKDAPPFAYRGTDGEWTGQSIELWRAVADELGLRYELRETTLDDMIAGVADGRYQDTTGLAIAVSSKRDPYWRGVIGTVFSLAFLRLIGVLALIQLTVGALVWLLERQANAEQFPRDPRRGVPTGFWWAIVTMTTVGYGDKAPKSTFGRAVALLWMLASMIIIASVTATIASSLTIERLDARISGPEDLHRFEVGVIANTTGAAYLTEQHAVTQSFADTQAALVALTSGEIDALVWDAPLLRSVIAENPDLPIELVPGVFQRQDYAIAVGEGSELREKINRLLPEKLRATD